MRTAIVIATCHRPEGIRALLARLHAGRLPPGLEVMVVENGRACGVEAIVSQAACAARCKAPGRARLRYLYQPRGNKSVALNHALAATNADLVIFLDDDITVSDGLVSAYVEAARRYGPGFFFGGGLVAEAEGECPAHLAPYLPRSARGWRPAEHEFEIAADQFDFFFGANWAAFRADLERAGLFSSQLGVSADRLSSGGEETELQARLVAAGGRAIYVPDALIGHPVPAAHFTTGWIRQRLVRQGAAEWTATYEVAPSGRAALLGAPVWLLRRLLREKLRRLAAAVTGAPIEVRTERAMEEARLTGLLLGAWRSRASSHAPRPEAPAARPIAAP
jgi:GT2 family glycosyltransferase